VTDDGGANGTVSHAVHVTAPVNKAPTEAFTSSCSALSCSFDGTGSSDSDGTVSGYSWDFGDGAKSTSASPTHSFAAAGDYPVTLTVTDNGGATDTVLHTVSPRPAANPSTDPSASDAFNRTLTSGWGTADKGGAWSAVGSGANLSVANGSGRLKLSAAGSAPGASLNSVSTSDSDSKITYTTDKAGTGNGIYLYLVGRHVSANNEYRARIRILSNNTVALAVTKLANSATETVIGSEVTLTGVTYTPGMMLNVRYQVTGTSPTTLRLKAWPSSSTEPTAWRITTTDGTSGLQSAGSVGVTTYLSGSATNAPVMVSAASYSVRPTVAPPTAAFAASTNGMTASVDGSGSSDPSGTISSYQWSWGDGSLSTGVTSTHTFAKSGTYRITLTVTDPSGWTDVTTRNVTVP
jgi:PKD repeat protein